MCVFPASGACAIDVCEGRVLRRALCARKGRLRFSLRSEPHHLAALALARAARLRDSSSSHATALPSARKANSTMANMNHTILAGNLTRDPELRYTSGTGTAVVRMTLAVNRRTKKGDQADYPTLVALRKLAELANTYLRKGAGVLVEGRLQTRSYTDKGDVKRYVTEVLVNEMQFLDKPQGIAGAASDVDDELEEDAPEF